MSKSISTDTLGRYLDGEIAGDERTTVEAEIARQPALAAELAELRSLDRTLKRAYGELLDEPLDSVVEGRIAASLAAARGARGDGARPSSPAGGGWPWRYVGTAIAASLVALAAAGFVGYRLAEWRFESEQAVAEAQHAQDRLLAERALEEALDETLSGTPVGWRNEASGSRGEVMPIRTFRNRDGRWCREYEARSVLSGQPEIRRGIACREDSGIWRTRVVSESDV